MSYTTFGHSSDNISDMYLIRFFIHEYLTNGTRRIAAADQPLNGRYFDPGLTNDRPGVVMEDGVKKIIWRSGAPYTRSVHGGELLKMECLHFQGMTKHLIIPTFERGLLQKIKDLPILPIVQ